MRKKAKQSDDSVLEAEVLELLSQVGVSQQELRSTAEQRQREADVAREAFLQIVATKPLPKRPFVTALRRLRIAVPAVGVAVAVLLVAIVAVTPHGRSERSTRASDATPRMSHFTLVSGVDRSGALVGENPKSALAALVKAASATVAPVPQSIQHITIAGWWYDGTQQQNSTAPLVPTLTELSYLANGKVHLREARGAPLDAKGRLTDAKPLEFTADEINPGPKQGPRYAIGLPTEPSQLIRRLIPSPRECPHVASCLANAMVQLYSQWVVPPGLTAALWESLSSSPDVSYLGESTDRLGRPAMAFAVPAARAEEETVLYADPSSGSLLASDQIVVRPERGIKLQLPAVVAFTVFAGSSWEPAVRGAQH